MLAASTALRDDVNFAAKNEQFSCLMFRELACQVTSSNPDQGRICAKTSVPPTTQLISCFLLIASEIHICKLQFYLSLAQMRGASELLSGAL